MHGGTSELPTMSNVELLVGQEMMTLVLSVGTKANHTE